MRKLYVAQPSCNAFNDVEIHSWNCHCKKVFFSLYEYVIFIQRSFIHNTKHASQHAKQVQSPKIQKRWKALKINVFLWYHGVISTLL